jgi:phosphoglycolate phosphatase
VRTALFDLDGTLTDPGPGILRCVRHALERMGREAPPPAELRRFIGPPLGDSFRSVLGDASAAEQAVAHYRELYRAEGLYECAVLPGIPELLSTLAARGWRVGVATSKPAVFARTVVEHFQLARHLDFLEGSELDGSRVDKGEVIAHALRQHGLAPGGAVMVGDREHDVRGARRNGLPCIGVTYGYGSREELLAAGADAVVDSPAAVLAAVLGAGSEDPSIKRVAPRPR